MSLMSYTNTIEIIKQKVNGRPQAPLKQEPADEAPLKQEPAKADRILSTVPQDTLKEDTEKQVTLTQGQYWEEEEEEEDEETDWLRCHAMAKTTNWRCRWTCPDVADFPKTDDYYCHWHDPDRRCHGKAITTGERCKFICTYPSVIINGKCYCQQHDPTKSNFQYHASAITQGHRCEIICNPSQLQQGVPRCDFHKT